MTWWYQTIERCWWCCFGGRSPDVAGLGEWGDSATNSRSRQQNTVVAAGSPKYEREPICNM